MAFESLFDSLLEESDLLDGSGKRPFERKMTLAQRHSNIINGPSAHAVGLRRRQWQEHNSTRRPHIRYAFSEDNSYDEHFKCGRCGADNRSFFFSVFFFFRSALLFIDAIDPLTLLLSFFDKVIPRVPRF
ncbi:unnamed protein product [Toxocara canis]|uniref:Uncharacterized protein n=1 Tax=Toxocara canis TaxID=6265 RepID=A0A183VFD5_TOXCA|nr:unnamed protein product [Toxocara canis]